MGSIQLLTDDGLKTVLFDGDQPSPRDMAKLREMFPYEQQLPMNEMGGTQTIPMTPTLPEEPPEPAPPPELKPDKLTPEQREMAGSNQTRKTKVCGRATITRRGCRRKRSCPCRCRNHSICQGYAWRRGRCE